MSSLDGALAELASALRDLEIPYAVIGGLAVSLWGEVRATLDVDLAVWVEAERIDATIVALSRRFEAIPKDPKLFVRETHVLPVVTSQGVRADIVFGVLPVEKELVGRARPKALAGGEVRVASVEDLILMKLISERERDLEDARKLLRRHRGTIDREYLRERLEGVAEGLGRPDIPRIVEEALGG
jgi:predicted nucleotidyltransferase